MGDRGFQLIHFGGGKHLGPLCRVGDPAGVPFAGRLENLGREIRCHGVHGAGSYSAASAVGADWAPRSRRPGRASVGVPSR